MDTTSFVYFVNKHFWNNYCVPGCTEGPVDLVFVIDGSKSLGEDNFEIVKQFVTGIIDSLAISPKAARVGLLQYSTLVRTEFTLRNFSSAKDMKKAVAHMKYMGKGSMTGLALKHMFERSFTQVEGARPLSARVPRVAIVFTDGRAQDDVSEWASKAQTSGITMYAVGVGKAIEEELQEIASEPTEKHLFYAEDFSTMGEISDKLQKGICEESEPVTINIRDLLSCSNFAVQHRYLFEEDNLARSTQKVFHSTKSSEPQSSNDGAHMQQLLKPKRREPVLRNERSRCTEARALRLQKAHPQHRRLSADKKPP
ncbi:hypothetical protein MG293_009995 [Ovis ammon polii]|uniref:VWFA domain-containing protein n=1 Tax=Ovis ammon polii TaxID=230172 RepID=A0AAD4U9K9_OVIAM|nr:hypothetical protein MG293_009995 [Ovis ammon polii]KAI4565945.1 hypothetical protein MJT46_009320 [Ovis ammon polii x Ovis aries]